MAYEHYWRRPREFPEELFLKFVDDVRRLVARLPDQSRAYRKYAHCELRVAGSLGTGKPRLEFDCVSFNGCGKRLSHDTFCIERVVTGLRPWKGLYALSCATARKPYDLLVCASLIALKQRFPTVRVLSDGGPKEWAEAVKLYKRAIGPAPAGGPWGNDRSRRSSYAGGKAPGPLAKSDSLICSSVSTMLR